MSLAFRFATFRRIKNLDTIIVGQGLAGSLLAWELIRAGQHILVVDREHQDSASMIAAGIVNPVTGPRLAPCWRLEQLLAHARHTYREIEGVVKTPVYRDAELVRIFRDDTERRLWMEKRSASGTNRFLGSMRPPGWRPNQINDPYGSFSPGGSGHLDVPTLLAAIGRFLRQNCQLEQTRFSYDELEFGESNVNWRNWSADRIVFCEGALGQGNPWFGYLPFKCAKGEVLTVEPPKSGLPKQIVNREKWILPSENGSFKAGSTYEWETLDAKPSAAGRDEILSALGKFIIGELVVTGHQAGVRPIFKDYRPAIGFHPRDNRLAIFNGFASKGALDSQMHAPDSCARSTA